MPTYRHLLLVASICSLTFVVSAGVSVAHGATTETASARHLVDRFGAVLVTSPTARALQRKSAGLVRRHRAQAHYHGGGASFAARGSTRLHRR